MDELKSEIFSNDRELTEFVNRKLCRVASITGSNFGYTLFYWE